jgi:hypothetical protein
MAHRLARIAEWVPEPRGVVPAIAARRVRVQVRQLVTACDCEMVVVTAWSFSAIRRSTFGLEPLVVSSATR